MTEFLIGSGLAAAATGLGAVPALLFSSATHKFRDVLLAFCSGVMMAAAAFELLPQALAFSDIVIVTLGVMAGILLLTLLEQNIPHVHLDHESRSVDIDNKAALIIAAISLHNLPEGLSVGVSYASGAEGLGHIIAIAIGLQNIPEGFLVAYFLLQQKVRKKIAFLLAMFTGLIEYAAAICGYVLTNYLSVLVPFGLAFAAGSMLYIVYKELIPESHGDGNALSATYSFIFGLLGMLWLTQL
ncbi:zinc transporter, ZIP family [Evansella caseinilytica]|uniref:Zinc transporter, ZIP family n=1 Tax=Evansella caseinilytica TaxID=1503961 RepID=A0A1H3NNM5_9BACI|nr:ZIP family metal transporter [Evansella caseinilytica]SDY90557.1 zinc transporter, ZIP family [Evansella caseinilytica]